MYFSSARLDIDVVSFLRKVVKIAINTALQASEIYMCYHLYIMRLDRVVSKPSQET